MEDKQYTEDETMKVLLNPEAYKKWKESQNKSQSHIELTDEAKAEIEKQLSDPLHASDSKLAHWIQDLWEHPEKSKIYRDEILFNNASHAIDQASDDGDGTDWRVEIPIFSMDF